MSHRRFAGASMAAPTMSSSPGGANNINQSTAEKFIVFTTEGDARKHVKVMHRHKKEQDAKAAEFYQEHQHNHHHHHQQGHRSAVAIGKQARGEACAPREPCPSCKRSSCQQRSCRLLDDGSGDACIHALRYTYVAYDYAGFPSGPQVGIPGVSQVITRMSDNEIEVATFGGLMPLPPAGQPQVVAPQGIGLTSGIPTYALVAISGIRDDNSSNANPGAHLLNTLWIVMPAETPGIWRLNRISLRGYQVDDVLVARNYMNSASLAPSPFIVRITSVNCPEQTFGFEQTNYSTLDMAIFLAVCGIKVPKCYCGGSRGSRCEGSTPQCSQYRIVHEMTHVTPQLHKSVNVQVHREHLSKTGQVDRTVQAGMMGVRVDSKSGRLVSASIAHTISEEEIQQAKTYVPSTRQVHGLTSPATLL